jgi:hypothetical protein
MTIGDRFAGWARQHDPERFARLESGLRGRGDRGDGISLDRWLDSYREMGGSPTLGGLVPITRTLHEAWLAAGAPAASAGPEMIPPSAEPQSVKVRGKEASAPTAQFAAEKWMLERIKRELAETGKIIKRDDLVRECMEKTGVKSRQALDVYQNMLPNEYKFGRGKPRKG